MNDLLRPRIWPSFLASSGVPSTGSGQAAPATYRSGTPRNQHPAVARHAAQAPALRVARPSSSRSLRSAQSRKRVPSLVVSRQQCIKYTGSLIGSQKSLGLHGNPVEIESGQVLFPEKQLAS